MKTIIENLKPVLESSDITLTLALDGNTLTMIVIPKAKNNSAKEFPALNFCGDVSEYHDAFIAELATKLQRNLPMINNIASFDNAIKKMEDDAKKKLETKSKTPAKPPLKPAVKPSEQTTLENEEEEEIEGEVEETSKETVTEQSKLF